MSFIVIIVVVMVLIGIANTVINEAKDKKKYTWLAIVLGVISVIINGLVEFSSFPVDPPEIKYDKEGICVRFVDTKPGNIQYSIRNDLNTIIKVFVHMSSNYAFEGAAG